LGEYFKKKEEVLEIFKAFLAKAASDPVVGPLLGNSKMVIRLVIADPDLSVTLSFGNPEARKAGAFLSFAFDGVDKSDNAIEEEPEAVLHQTSDYIHHFWLGLENLGVAIINGRIKVSGDYIKAVTLLHAIKPFFRTYREVLKEAGLNHLIPQDKN
jgi:hypothetical protein